MTVERKTCAYPDPTPEWACGSRATHIVVGLHGSGHYETFMPRCNVHLAATIAMMQPPGSPYPYHVLGRVEPVKP